MLSALNTASTRIRIAIVDDHPIFRDGLRHLLETDSAFEIVGEGSNGADALRIAREQRPEVLLLDYAMPDVNGVEVIRQIGPGPTRIVLLTAAIEADEVVRAIQLGARGVIMKESATRSLLAGIHRVAAGSYILGSETMSDVAEAVARLSEAPKRPFNLTPREFEITLSVADGATNAEIATRLSISLQTVKHHLTSIFEKTGLSSRLELALFAIDNGLVKRSGRPRPHPVRP